MNKKLAIKLVELGVTQREISEHLNMKPQNFSKIVHGYIPGADTQSKIAEILDCKVDEIF